MNILEKKVQLSGLILTHAHEDHIGAVPYLYKYLNNIPIYTTPFTASVLKRKFESVGCTNYKIILLEYVYAPVAQLDRASGYGPEG